MKPIPITRAEYAAKFGAQPSAPASVSSKPIPITRAEYAVKFGAQPSAPATPTTQVEQPSLTSQGPGSIPGLKQITQFGVGVGTAIGKAGLNLGAAASKAASVPFGLVGANRAQKFLGEDVPMASEMIKKAMYEDPFKSELDSTAGKVGTVVGTVAPYIASGGKTAALTNKATGLIKGSGFIPAASRVATGAGTEGLLNYGLTYGLTGGDKSAALASGLTAGILKGTTSAVGEGLKGLKADESIMNRIYKTDAKETGQDLFGKFKPEKSLAKEALDRGITGNVTNQAKQITTGMAQAEQRIGDEFAKAGNPFIKVKNPQRFFDAILKEAEIFKNAGADDAAAKIEKYAEAINQDGTIRATDALSLRRLIDGFTNFRKSAMPTTQLSAEQAGFREMGNELRNGINKIGGVGDIMKDYIFYMNAKDKLIKYAVSSKNKEALDLFEKMLLTESLATANPYGTGIALFRKAASRLPASTAQAVKALPQSSKAGSTLRTVVGAGAGEFFK